MANIQEYKIPLSMGLFALVDKSWYDMLSTVKWCATHAKKGGQPYAISSFRYNGISYQDRMHRLIVDAPSNMHVDHINGDTLDNRHTNLRIVTVSQNQCNKRPRIGCASKYKGVIKSGAKWISRLTKEYKHIHIGTYPTEIDAALAYNAAAIEQFGEFAKLNEVPCAKS